MRDVTEKSLLFRRKFMVEISEFTLMSVEEFVTKFEKVTRGYEKLDEKLRIYDIIFWFVADVAVLAIATFLDISPLIVKAIEIAGDILL